MNGWLVAGIIGTVIWVGMGWFIIRFFQVNDVPDDDEIDERRWK